MAFRIGDSRSKMKIHIKNRIICSSYCISKRGEINCLHYIQFLCTKGWNTMSLTERSLRCKRTKKQNSCTISKEVAKPFPYKQGSLKTSKVAYYWMKARTTSKISSFSVSAIISQWLFRIIMFAECVLIILKLNWYKGFADKKNKWKNCR